jgi:hypothetical protein
LIRIQAAGGLGNQLFTYNLAHALANHYKTRIQIIFPKTPGDRKNELENLVNNCNHGVYLSSSLGSNYFFRLLDKIKRYSQSLHSLVCFIVKVYESDNPSDSFDFKRKRPYYVRGYYQSPELVLETLHVYSHEITECVEQEFKKAPESVKILKRYAAIHIRRGDYLENKGTVGLLSNKYFRKNYPSGETSIICTDALTDDVSINQKFPDGNVIGADEADTWVSFAILSKSDYLLVSNSTFSWWAGLIVAGNGGTVIAPNPWTLTPIYGDTYLNTPLFHYVPAEFELP